MKDITWIKTFEQDSIEQIHNLMNIWAIESITDLCESVSQEVDNIQKEQELIKHKELKSKFNNINNQIIFLKYHLAELAIKKIDYRQIKDWRWDKFKEYFSKIREIFPNYNQEYLSRYVLFNINYKIKNVKYEDFPVHIP